VKSVGILFKYQIPSFLIFSFSLLVILVKLFEHFTILDTIDEFI